MWLSLCVANLWGKAKAVEGVISVEMLLIVINGVNLGFALGHVDVVVDVLAGPALGSEASLADAITF